MKWGNVFEPVKTITEAEAKEYFESHDTNSYQLVDVRLHEEYEENHLPGAKLIPLHQLMEGRGDLNPNLPTIVYCRSGGRSQAASQWLSENGFKEVYDISSNIVDWMGIQLEGGYHYDLNLIRSDAEFNDVFELSYAMEEGLQQFYNKLEQEEDRPELKAVYKKLSGFEDLHKEELLKRNKEADKVDIESVLTKQGNVVEGGESNRMSPFQVIEKSNSIQDIYALSLAIEAQSFDLYVRLAEKADDSTSKTILMHMADEEKTHMQFISGELAKVVQAVA